MPDPSCENDQWETHVQFLVHESMAPRLAAYCHFQFPGCSEMMAHDTCIEAFLCLFDRGTELDCLGGGSVYSLSEDDLKEGAHWKCFSFLKKVAFRRLSKSLKRLKRQGQFVVLHQNIQSQNPQPHVRLQQTEQHEEIRSAIESLPPHQRTAIWEYYIEGKSIAEIAEDRGIPKNTIKGQLKRGREALSEKINWTF